MKLKFTLAIFCLTFSALAQAETGTNAVNYDESKVPPYTLPDPLVCADGTRVTSAKIWEEKRRPELVKLFEEQIYGRAPGRPNGMHFELTSLATNALGGIATRKEVAIWFTRGTNGPGMHLLLYLPNAARKPVPAFLSLNFTSRAQDWPPEKILARGYALAAFYYGDLEPDRPDGWKLGVRAALSPQGTNTVFKPDDWGAISAWAWGASRALDYLETDRAIDAKRVAVIGHSRLGKTALWAGAHDQRFALVIANESGEGGAALARRWFGETTALVNRHFPHWFDGNFKKFSDHDDAMPVDQHEVIALAAPRPVYIASAVGDQGSDPRGEFLSAKGAEPVYQLYGETGLGVSDWPPPNHPVGDFIGYHIRAGGHDLAAYDLEQFLNFADHHFKQSSTTILPQT